MKQLKDILRNLEEQSDIDLFVIDLFCGAGGLSEGVEEARLDGNADIIALSEVMPELYAELSFSETNALTNALNRLAAYVISDI